MWIEDHIARLTKNIKSAEASLKRTIPDSVRNSVEIELLLLKTCRSLLVRGDVARENEAAGWQLQSESTTPERDFQKLINELDGGIIRLEMIKNGLQAAQRGALDIPKRVAGMDGHKLMHWAVDQKYLFRMDNLHDGRESDTG